VTRKRPVTLDPRSAAELSAYEVIGAFFDVSYAYRFGPPGHDVTVARLTDARTGAVIAEALHHPLGLGHPWPVPVIRASVETGEDGAAVLVLETDAYAPLVHVDAGARRAEDDWFGLAPGFPKRLRLIGEGPVAGTVTTPGGRVRVGFSA
jgi:beta-mannosidase